MSAEASLTAVQNTSIRGWIRRWVRRLKWQHVVTLLVLWRHRVRHWILRASLRFPDPSKVAAALSRAASSSSILSKAFGLEKEGYRPNTRVQVVEAESRQWEPVAMDGLTAVPPDETQIARQRPRPGRLQSIDEQADDVDIEIPPDLLTPLDSPSVSPSPVEHEALIARRHRPRRSTSEKTLEAPDAAGSLKDRKRHTPLPYKLPRWAMGTRWCGCAQSDRACRCKDDEELIRSHRRRSDLRALIVTFGWIAVCQLPEGVTSGLDWPWFIRRAFLAALQLKIESVPPIVVLYRAANRLNSALSPSGALLWKAFANVLGAHMISHPTSTCSLGSAMLTAGANFHFPVLSVRRVPLPHVDNGPKAVFLATLQRAPSVALQIMRFYAVLFFVVRPVMRQKTPFTRHNVKEFAGACFAVLYARQCIVNAGLIQTTSEDPRHLALAHIARMALTIAQSLLESWLVPVTGGMDLFYTFLQANVLLGAGSFVCNSYERFCNAVLVIDAFAPWSAAAPLLGF